MFNGLSADEANLIEIELIKYFNSTDPACGYNSSPGGSTSGKHYLTAEDAIKARKATQHRSYKKMVSNEDYADRMRKKSAAYHNEHKNDSDYMMRRRVSSKNHKLEVRQLRDTLRDFYTKDSSLFTEADFELAFGFNGRKNYKCNSVEKLTQLLDDIKERYEK